MFLNRSLKTFLFSATCGQMHGCVFWRSSHITTDIDLMQSFNLDDLSNLITWQDQRCDEEFLTSLPVSKTCPAPLSSGKDLSNFYEFGNYRYIKKKT